MSFNTKVNYTKIINILLVLLAFSTPISRAGIVLFSASAIILWLLELNLKNKLKALLKNPIIIALLLFMLFNIIALAWNDSFIDGVKYIKKYWYFFVIFVMYTSLKKRYIPYMINAFLLGMFISEILSLGIFFEWWQFKKATPELPTPFMHHIQYSLFLAVTALLLLNKAFIVERLRYKLAFSLYFIFVSINLFVNGGRTGQLAFLVTLFIVGILNMKNKIQSFFLMMFLVAFTLVAGYNLSPNFKQRLDIAQVDATLTFEKQDYCDSIGQRVGAWIIAQDMIQEDPILGVGVSDSMPILYNYVREKHPEKKCVLEIAHFHNDYVQTLVQLGIIGFFLYILLFYRIFTIPIGNKEYKNLSTIFISVFAISSMFENLFHLQFPLSLFSLFIGIAVTMQKHEPFYHDNK